VKLINNDCIEAMKAMSDNSVDSIVTDPPYELGFMGKSWDASGIAFNIEVWQEALRVLKPGGHLIAFSGSRTYHRMAVAIEDAGFQIRDQIMWVYGSGFPKSLNISKSIEAKITTGSANKTAFKNLKGEQIERGNWGIAKQQFDHGQRDTNYDETAGETRLGNLEATTLEAIQWDGWGTALKPAHEPMVLARKPLEGTVANNVLTWGVGGLNIDGSRVVSDDWDEKTVLGKYRGTNEGNDSVTNNFGVKEIKSTNTESTLIGRFPANFIHDGSDEVLALFPDTGKSTGGRIGKKTMGDVTNVPAGEYEAGDPGYGDSGSAARFFYCAKASKRDRNEGLDDAFQAKKSDTRDAVGAGIWEQMNAAHKNHHPTVKPTDLMRYLCRLVTPPAGIVLDPFMGSGSTGKAAMLEGFDFIGIEQSAEYVEIAKARIAWAKENA
jgi:site-specific DNA-methyltransferase (adenine-specific)